jgi:maleate isomerase
MAVCLLDMTHSQKMKKLGIIAAPGWFDPTMLEFLDRHRSEIDVTQTILLPIGFDWTFESIRRSEVHLTNAAKLLAEAGSEVIAQVGPAFAYQVGKTPAGARQLAERLTFTCGVPVILNGVAVLDVFDELAVRRIAAACPYYSSEWKSELLGFLIRSNFRVDAFQTFVEQGLFSSQDEVSARQYQFSEIEVSECVRRTHVSAPDVEAILISGSGVRTLQWIDALQGEIGVPLVSADRALYQAVVRHMGLKSKSSV